MTAWKARISFDAYRHVWTDENAAEMGKSMAAQLRKLKHFQDDLQLLDAIEALEDITGFDGDSPLDELYARIHELYDWADSERVWIEPRSVFVAETHP